MYLLENRYPPNGRKTMPAKKVISMRHAFILTNKKNNNLIIVIIASCCYGHENGSLMCWRCVMTSTKKAALSVISHQKDISYPLDYSFKGANEFSGTNNVKCEQHLAIPVL